MTSRRWMIQTLLASAMLAAGVVIANVSIDLYGLFRDTHGRRLGLYDSERRGKYLLNQRYVPENFDALLLGSSVTSSWNTALIGGVTMYNESADGGNATEEKLFAEEYLRSRSPRLVLFTVHPYITDGHGLGADEMNRREYWAALGSTTLFQAYKGWLYTRRHHVPPDWDGAGTEVGDGPDRIRPMNGVLRRVMTSPGDVPIDPVALDEYRALIAEMRARGARIVAVVPPTAAPVLEAHRARLDGYARRILALFAPGDLVVDMNGPDAEWVRFRSDPGNYCDGVHLTRSGGREIVRLLDQRIRELASPGPRLSATTLAP